MKNILFVFISICFFCLSVNAQTQKIRSLDHTVKDNALEYKIPVQADGAHSVVIINPQGETLSWPVKDKVFKKGQTIDFTLNSKYWSSGTYRIQIMHENKSVDMYAINVGLTQRARARIE